MGIYRGAGGTGDAISDSSSEAILVRQLIAEAQVDADAAATSATAAQAAETQARISKGLAEDAATAAATSATNAANSAASITGDVTDAQTAATAAQTAQTAAELAETNAETAATNAASSASAASTSATNAATSATNASNSASAASTSATNASNSASSASTSATNAANSATSASGSASTATTQASNASTSASNAATSATSASGSASTATTQAGIATTQASNASTSASAASTSASNASSSASAASTSATNASNSATAAASSATTASTAADAALAALDSFDDRYLGQKSTAPTVDNDGNALVTGSLYFNTTTNEMKVWDGSMWLNAYASLSGALIAANNLSDLTNTGTARTNLGLAIGTNVQAYDSDLATIAGLTPTNQYAIIGNGTSWTSAALPATGVTSVTGTSPVVSSGGNTPAISLAANYGDTQNPYASKTANFVLAAPNGSAGAPTFRAIVAADIPTLNQNTTGTASNVTGTVAIANGGTGETTRQAAIDALAGAVTSGQYLRGNGTDVVMSAIQAADVPTLNQNTTGTASNVTGTVAIANGGTGQTTANAAYNALSPMTTTGDITYEATGGIATRLPIGTAGQVLTVTSGIPAWATAGGGGVSWQSVQTSSFTATSNRGYPVNTTSASITATLPASPTAGDTLTFVDYAATWQTNLFIIAPNGQKFLGTTGSRTLNQTREGITIVYIDSTQGWLPVSGINAITPIGEISVEYLAVAGGGGGGGEYGAGGGGAGGLLTSTITNITIGTSYTVTVGAGGAGSSSGSNKGTTGSNSVFSSVTASGGGGGGSFLSTTGANGGSGGGGTTNGAGGTGTSGQGNTGGTGSTISTAPNGAGGGGASAVGGNATLNGAAGSGGAGSASSITGTSVTRAGGGGGANDARFGSSHGAGGAGGGGAGSSTNGVAGTANTGGGGGGAGNVSNSGGAGGSGVVILKYADSFTIANSGGGLTFSTASSGGFKVTTFTAGTGNITFN